MAAGYALYGSATTVVLALGKGSGVNEFMLDPVNAFTTLSSMFYTWNFELKGFKKNKNKILA